MRVFTPEQVELIRKTLREKARLGPKPEPELIGLVAQFAGLVYRGGRHGKRRLVTGTPDGFLDAVLSPNIFLLTFEVARSYPQSIVVRHFALHDRQKIQPEEKQ